MAKALRGVALVLSIPIFTTAGAIYSSATAPTVEYCGAGAAPVAITPTRVGSTHFWRVTISGGQSDVAEGTISISGSGILPSNVVILWEEDWTTARAAFLTRSLSELPTAAQLRDSVWAQAGLGALADGTAGKVLGTRAAPGDAMALVAEAITSAKIAVSALTAITTALLEGQGVPVTVAAGSSALAVNLAGLPGSISGEGFLLITSGALKGQARPIVGLAGAVCTVAPAFPAIPATGASALIVGFYE